ncbi:GTP-binding protein [Tulasnella sp. JGI-2019a]|nr:GTP-binding protein [Tulasnella sp. JGI-2019a]
MSISGIPSPAPLEELKFRGGPNEDVSDFLGAIKRAAIKQDRHLDDKWMVSYTESCLRGDAMEWFDEMGPDVATMDWMSLRVGKSCLLSRQLGRGWVSSTTPTVGIHYETSTRLARFEAGDLVVDKQAFWDASGKDEYRSLIGPYCPGTTRIWIVYDITDQKSFQDVRRWFDLVMQHNSTAKTILRLVGNKCDLHNRRVVQQQQGRDLAKELGISQFYETSAKTNEGIQEMWNLWFETITQFKP